METVKERLLWAVILAMEMLVALIGNALAIAVFWKQRSTVKRTSYLLINLSIADFLVGMGEIIHLVENVLYFENFKSVISVKWDGTFFISDVFPGSASLKFLTLISMERLYAIAWPYQHRTMTTRVYIYFIVVAWFLSAAMTVIYLCGFTFEIINEKIATHVGASLMALCLIVITCSYLAIWISNKKRKNLQRIAIDRREQDKKLAMTLFIVTTLSVLAWMPSSVNIIVIGTHQYNELFYNFARFLQLVNSSINPIMYYARMPDFRKQLRNMIVRQNTLREQQGRQPLDMPMGDVSIPVLISFSTLNIVS